MHLTQVRPAVTIPVLRKDFLIDEYQIVEARSAGADAILLIAEILDDMMLGRLLDRANDLGMAALVEFHDAANLDRVLASGANLIGINNRNLDDFVRTSSTRCGFATGFHPRSYWSVKAAFAIAVMSNDSKPRESRRFWSANHSCEPLTSGWPWIGSWGACPRILCKPALAQALMPSNQAACCRALLKSIRLRT